MTAAPDESAAPAAEPAPPDAPWLKNPQAWVTEEVAGQKIRPGWYVFVRETSAFTAVVTVSRINSRTGRVSFVDLADGRTLALADGSEIFVRHPAG